MKAYNGGKILEPKKDLTTEELREKARKMGKASGRVRRKKKAIKEIFRDIANTPLTDEKIRRQLAAAGVTDENITIATAVVYKAFQGAFKGHLPNIRFIVEMLGELPEIKIKERELKLREKQLHKEQEESINITIERATQNEEENKSPL